ncbi:MAG: hypothetical protein JO159_04405 [Acidobacteria bacterium]|nr:hypothetical protein [Acidobacteriota bacterium]MBV9626131.1 hypothetical protein [Acidobacteriota bacterium]
MNKKPQMHPPNQVRWFPKLRYALKCLPSYLWQRATRPAARGQVHLIIALADHFEPSNIPGHNAGYAPPEVQDQRVETWCREYSRCFESFRDNDGHHFVHTYFYPAEQYDAGRIERLAELCRAGWGEIEIHLHHGIDKPATAESTRHDLVCFRDALALRHGCLSYEDGDDTPKYAFVHGNYALANCAGGFACGVDSEMEVLAETGCYADMTYPTSSFHAAQIAKLNSLYECGLPLKERAPQRRGRVLKAGRRVSRLPLIVQGPWMLDFSGFARNRLGRIDNSSISHVKFPSFQRLSLWKKAAICVRGRPDWLFIKLHTHGMDPQDTETVIGKPMQEFLAELTREAPARGEILHFVTAREMVNIILAACDGRDGEPGDFRDYRYKRFAAGRADAAGVSATAALKR